MDGEETKNCPNCKRDIPAVNFTIHSVHCARNIKICPVCKEPVPGAELQDHHDKLHKLLPCRQCGESVCGTDLEDHIRDSCANTIKTCRYCDLELPRRELPAHEGYCGVRTERCPACREYVMLKYRQLHLDSNHGFLRLDDDPVPPKKDPIKPINTRPQTAATSNGSRSIFDDTAFNPRTNLNPRPLNTRPGLDLNTRLETRPNLEPTSNTRQENRSNLEPRPNRPSHLDIASNLNTRSNLNARPVSNLEPRASSSVNGAYSKTDKGPAGFDQPSTSNGRATNIGRAVNSGVKKRTNDQPQINTNTSATKSLDKDLPSSSRGAVKKRAAPLPPPKDERDRAYYSAVRRQNDEERRRREQTEYNLAHGLPPVLNPAAKLDKLRKLDAMTSAETAEEYRRERERDRRRLHNDAGVSREDFKDLKPMTPEQFLARFSSLAMEGAPPAGAPQRDRFSQIKTSLTELRRGLNEVTAPYNNNSNNNNERGRSPSPYEERLPCEFCEMLLHPNDLVQHQTGCRPDLAQLRPLSPALAPPRSPPRSPTRSPLSPPLIPCEFCAEPHPIYLIAEHQESCPMRDDEDASSEEALYSPD